MIEKERIARMKKLASKGVQILFFSVVYLRILLDNFKMDRRIYLLVPAPSRASGPLPSPKLSSTSTSTSTSLVISKSNTAPCFTALSTTTRYLNKATEGG